jgi:hypothetical protein
MGRRRMGWQELKSRGAQDYRWQRRKTEDEAPQVDPSFIIGRFKDVYKKAGDTFQARRDKSSTICKTFDGSVFTFPEEHPLTGARITARKIAKDGQQKLLEVIGQCEDFVRDLIKGYSYKVPQYMDPEFCDAAELFVCAYGEPSDARFVCQGASGRRWHHAQFVQGSGPFFYQGYRAALRKMG